MRYANAADSIRCADVGSVDAILARLEQLGVLAATAPTGHPLWAPAEPLFAPALHIDTPSNDLGLCVGRFHSWQQSLRRAYLEELPEVYPVGAVGAAYLTWALHALWMTCEDKGGVVCTRTPEMDDIYFVPPTAPFMNRNGQSLFGCALTPHGLMLLHNALVLSPRDSFIVGTHELAHLLSAWRVTMPASPGHPEVYGFGLKLGECFFEGFNEAATAQLTTRALYWGQRYYGAQARQVERMYHALGGGWAHLGDGSYAPQSRVLNDAMAAIYAAYTGHPISTRFFLARRDEMARAIRVYRDRALIGGDLTFYGLLYHAVGYNNFHELSHLGV